MLCPSNFAVHSFYGQYDLWLLGGVAVFGEFEYGPQTIDSSADGRAFFDGGKIVNILRHGLSSCRYRVDIIV